MQVVTSPKSIGVQQDRTVILPKFFLLGLKESAPVAVSFVISFFAVGALSRASELTFAQSVAMTALVFAGPAQYAILSFFTSGSVRCLREFNVGQNEPEFPHFKEGEKECY